MNQKKKNQKNQIQANKKDGRKQRVALITGMLLVTVMLLPAAGCAAKNTTGQIKTQAGDSAQLLNQVWEALDESQKFAAMGGDFGNPVDNAAGIFNIEDTENLTYMLYIPSENVAMIDEAASLIHAMNVNTFTGAAFHLTDAANAQKLADALKNNILNTQWMCGFPDELAIYVVNGEYVVSAFGNAELMANFKAALTEVYGEGAVIAAEEKIA